MTTEGDRVAGFGRLEDGLRQASPWYIWGPYVSERQWGTVREDYSEDGDAWNYLPFDHARSRAYRWGEDGLAGFSDIHQDLCIGLALWNGRDAFLKERLFGLTGPEGNHGEDVKEHWWYTDAVPSHGWNRWRYHYPQAAFPYDDLRTENARRDRRSPEYEILDTGVFDADRYWVTEVTYAKSDDAAELLMEIRVTNASQETDTVHVLPTAWFRNTWSWEEAPAKPSLKLRDGVSAAATDAASGVDLEHPFLGSLELLAGTASDGTAPTPLFCENETNNERLFNCMSVTRYPKDGINDHVVSGAATVNPEQSGTKCAFWYTLTVRPQETAVVRVRLRPQRAASGATAFGQSFDAVLAKREAEADEFYQALTPAAAGADEANVMRQAFAGMLWSKQFYNYSVSTWLDGDPTQPAPPQERELNRNARWRNFSARDIMSMPDKWEYPWFAAWDLAFHCVSLAHVDPGQHPNGALPAYEWDFSDVNPPVQAWAALEVFVLDGSRDLDFLARIFDKLLVNFTWWVNREDMYGNNLFEGGFLGLDNIGPIDRSHLPPGAVLEQSDATGWMAFYALSMAQIASILWREGRRHGSDLVLKFLEHYASIAEAMDNMGMWDDEEGMYYDHLSLPSGVTIPVKARSMVGMIPLLAVAVVDEAMVRNAMKFGKQFADFLGRQGLADEADQREQGLLHDGDGVGHSDKLLLSVVGKERLAVLLTSLFDESRFLSPYGLRSLSAVHRDQPYVLHLDGTTATIDYEPAESTTAMFGGNSNWRGPIWFPLNYLITNSMLKYHRFFGDEFTVEYPTGSGQQHTLGEIAADLRERMVTIFVRGEDGRRPCYGWVDKLQHDPRWRDNIYFNEYYHGDNAAGLGATHQTGWTGLIADVIRRRHGAVPETGEAIADLLAQGEPPQ
jgi:hypothetical protein